VLSHVLTTVLACPVADVVLVLGAQAEAIQRSINVQDDRAHYVINNDVASGMLSSVQVGLGALDQGCDAFLLVLGDQPFMEVAVIQALIAGYEPGAILVPTHNGRRGHPPLICCSYRAEIAQLGPDGGLRGLFQNHPERVRLVPMAEPSIHVDLDTPADYERYKPREE
jgi:molybdenum cofactor cytidylyltransferase